MAFQSETIPFTLRSGVGTQTISLVRYPSMTPLAVLFTSTQPCGANRGAYNFGFDDGIEHMGNSSGFTETFGVCLSARMYSSVYSLVSVHAQAFFGGAAEEVRGYVSALNVGSFDITLDLNNNTGWQWYATVFGGSGVEAAVGLFDVTGGSGNKTVGFDPIAIIELGVVDAGSTGFVAGAAQHMGYAVPCNDNQVGWGAEGGTITSNARSIMLDGFIDTVFDSNTAAGSTPAASKKRSISAWISNGFSVSVGADTGGWNIGYLALGGSALSANLVSFTVPATASVKNVTIDATNPKMVLFGSINKPTATTVLADYNLAFGLYDGASNLSHWVGEIDGASFPFSQDSLTSTTKSLQLATATGAGTSTITTQGVATLSSTVLSVNFSQVSGNQEEVWALVLADNLTGSTNVCGVNPTASITVLKQCTPIAGGETEFPFATSGGLSPSTFMLLDGESQLFPGIAPGTYAINEAAPGGWAASYSVSNGDPHTAIEIDGTEAVTVTVTNTFQTTGRVFRKYRRWALPYDGNKRIFIPRIEIVAQMGVGNSDDPDPVMYLRISPDGGQTWGPRRQMPLGAAGETMVRAYLTRFCQGLRNPVAELYCDDDVFVAWVECVLPQDYSVGTS